MNKQRATPARRWPLVLLNMLLVLVALVLTAAVALGVVLSWYLATRVDPNFDEETAALALPAGASQLYYYDFTDRPGRVGERHPVEGGRLEGGVHVLPVSYAQLPQELIDAFVAIEDQQFWSHHGVNWPRTLQAAFNYCLGYTRQFGASTITQQLIKNLTGDKDYSIGRKLTEMCRANDLENRWSKEQILERYLNIINLSRGCYGVGAAADRFFGKTVAELSLSECAALAGITNNPSYYDPVRFPEHTKARRDLILRLMLSEGYISEEECAAAMAEELTILPSAGESRAPVYSWYVDMVVEDVIADLCAAYGYSRDYAGRLLYCGGLTIDIAMDAEMQEAVENFYRDSTNFPTHADGSQAQSGMIVIDPATGDILAVAGAVGEKAGNRLLDHATMTRRPTASAIKPLSVYAPALEAGEITWASVLDDTPVTLREGSDSPLSGAWPKNADRVYRGRTDVRYALSHSVNTVAVRVLRRLGTDKSFAYMHDTLGMTSLIESATLSDGRRITDRGEAALALGQMNYGVTLRELTAGYTALANSGVFVEPRSYFRVLAPDGRVLLSRPTAGRYALSEQNASIMTHLLETVVTRGTGKGAQLFGGRVAVAGKTGTSNADLDRYFVGYTPGLLAGVWYGFDTPRPLNDLGTNPAVAIWRQVMEDILTPAVRRGALKTQFDTAPGVLRASYCRDSGLRPTEACRADLRGDRTDVGYFVAGTEPRSYCDCHVLRDYDTARDLPADEDTRPEDRRSAGLLRLHREEHPGISVLDERYALPEQQPLIPWLFEE